MESFSKVDIFDTQGIEYLFALGYLLVLIVFWKVSNKHEGILKQIKKMSEDCGMGVLFITHDLGVVAEIANDIFIMKNGVIVENGTVEEIFHNPQLPITTTPTINYFSFRYLKKQLID